MGENGIARARNLPSKADGKRLRRAITFLEDNQRSFNIRRDRSIPGGNLENVFRGAGKAVTGNEARAELEALIPEMAK
jgi:hypothetical protein